MTAIYNPTPVALTTVTEPVDTEPRTVASVTQMTRAIADGVKLAQDRMTPLADLATLTAILVPTDGMVRHVLGFGWYVFKTSATTGLSPFRLAADDLTAGGWVSSSAHETTLTRFISGNRVAAKFGSVNPATLFLAFGGGLAASPVVAADVVLLQGAFRPAVASTDATNAYGFMFPIDDSLVDGANIASVTAHFFPAGAVPAPGTRPRLAVTRMSRSTYGADPESLLSSSFATDSGGTYASNRSLVYTPDQNATVDLSTYSYAVVLFDHHGTGAVAGNEYHGITIALSAVPDARR